MKKNKMMRLASGLLVAVLITTSTISGTFAKYVTTDSASDSARVAKWGVMLAADGYLFDDTYKLASNIPGEDGDDAAALSVVSDTTAFAPYTKGENIVAPGTENNDGITFSITGKPEVDVSVSVAYTTLNNADKDIFLNGTDLPDTTTYDDTTDKFSITNYYPIKYTLWQKTSGASEYTEVAGAKDVNLSALKAKMSETLNKTYDANTDLATVLGDFKITWKWDFGVAGAPANDYDRADTLLGNLAAGTAYTWKDGEPANTTYNLSTGINFTITVEQID